PHDGHAAGVRTKVVADLRLLRAVVPALRAGPVALGHVARVAVVCVRAADEPELERVHADRLLEAEAVLERRPYHVPARVLPDRNLRRVGALMWLRILLERA